MINERVYDKAGLATLSTIDAFFEAENKPYLANHTKPLCDAPLLGPLGLGCRSQVSRSVRTLVVLTRHKDNAYVDQKPC